MGGECTDRPRWDPKTVLTCHLSRTIVFEDLETAQTHGNVDGRVFPIFGVVVGGKRHLADLLAIAKSVGSL